jgi:hypothetical protein
VGISRLAGPRRGTLVPVVLGKGESWEEMGFRKPRAVPPLLSLSTPAFLYAPKVTQVHGSVEERARVRRMALANSTLARGL